MLPWAFLFSCYFRYKLFGLKLYLSISLTYTCFRFSFQKEAKVLMSFADTDSLFVIILNVLAYK